MGVRSNPLVLAGQVLRIGNQALTTDRRRTGLAVPLDASVMVSKYGTSNVPNLES
jgi:hypothetical protein